MKYRTTARKERRQNRDFWGPRDWDGSLISQEGKRWGDDVSEKRQSELDATLAAWDAETDHSQRKGPFDVKGMSRIEQRHLGLTGADIFYLAARALLETPSGDWDRPITNLAAARATLRNDGDYGFRSDPLLNLVGANLRGANLKNAKLVGANLENAELVGANLENAELNGARLANADLAGAHLTSANLGFARLDRETNLSGVALGGVSLDQIVFDNTNLTVVSWESVAPLGDETRARAVKDDYGNRKGRAERIGDYEAAVRANRLLATALRTQGLAEDADVFAYRAQVMQRGLRFQRRQFGRWLVSWGLAALSGYGYRLGRIFAAYAIVVLTFAALFLLPTVLNGAIPTIQQAADALQISLNAIHGRVFFVQFGLDTLQSWLATAESVIGIVIEGVFVAMIIQRLFR